LGKQLRLADRECLVPELLESSQCFIFDRIFRGIKCLYSTRIFRGINCFFDQNPFASALHGRKSAAKTPKDCLGM
jgi:hypothetical protein